MSVREINDKFKGLRVQRNVNKKTHQKHFSYRIPVRRNGVTAWRDATAAEKLAIRCKAEAYDRKLAVKQKEELKEKPFDPFSGKTNTGIKGIAYRTSKDSQGYEVEAFWLNVSVDKRQHSSNVRLGPRSWAEAWKLIVTKLVEVKGLTPAVGKKLVATLPSEKKLRK
jgi:hypothetical protein